MKDRWIICYAVACLTVYYSTGCTIKHFEGTCGCAKDNVKRGPSGKKLTCYPIDVKHFFETVYFPDDVIRIDFSGNHEEQLSALTFGTNERVLKYLQNVYQLDFSNNGIWKISSNTFMPVRNLTRLNLSQNNIGNLTQGMFNGLSRLQVLDLSFNKFPIIPGFQYAFKSLASLQKIYLRSSNFVCNCLMKDFVNWLKDKDTNIKAIGTCHLPKDGVRLQKLDPSKMVCNVSNIVLPYFEVTPSKPQLVVQGDRIDIKCEVTNLPDSRLYWSLNQTQLRNDSNLYSFTTSVNPYRSIITGWLTVNNVVTSHTGLWNCMVESPYGKSTRSTQWTVIKRRAQYCKGNGVENNHGEFRWPATVEGLSRNVQCGNKEVFATRFCQQEGWANGNYINCPYNNFVTNEIHSALKASSAFQSKANILHNLISTLGGRPITERLALDFLNEILVKRMRSLTIIDKDKIGQALLDLGSYIMKTNVSLLREAESRNGMCERIVELIKSHNVRLRTSAVVEEESENIAIRAVMFEEKSQLNSEMTCAISENKLKLHVFCQAVAIPKPQSSIFLPQTVLDTCTKKSGVYKIYFIAYRNGELFQTSLSLSNKGNVTLPADESSEMVFQVDVYGCTPKNLSDPIIFNFLTKDKGSHFPVVWTSNGWKKDDACSAVCMSKNLTRVVCYKFATVTLIYDSHMDVDWTKSWTLTASCHPAILAATIILLLCLLTVMIHYVFYAEKIRVDRESQHVIINICFHLLMAASLFAFCVKLGSDQEICIICGILLHYASLTVLFWITLSVRNILRQLVTLTKPPMLEPRPAKPMLRFYLIGCGIPLIICGITAAAKVENYGGEKKYCWLTWETSIYAFYLPAAFVAVVCIFYLLRVLCTFNQQSVNFGSNRSPVIGQSWQRDKRINNTNNRYQAISTREPCQCSELLNHNRVDGPLHHHHASCPLGPIEQSFKSQLAGTAVLFVLYLFTWVAAALSVAVPNVQLTVSVNSLCMKTNEEHSRDRNFYDGFSWLYALLVIAIGVFALTQSLVLRKTCRSRIMKFLGHENVHDDDVGSIGSISKREHLDDVNLDHLTSSNDKSVPMLNKKHRGYLTIKTDPTSETMLESTDVVGNFIADGTSPYQDAFLKSHWNNDLAGNCEPCIIHDNNGFAASSMQKNLSRGQYSHNESRLRSMDFARRSQFSHHHHSHDVCRMDRQGYHSEALPYHHTGYLNHHVSHHHDHGKVMKMTNLHVNRDASITDHSIDDAAFNNMHTVPVIMQNHTQAKVNNGAMVDRYQKMRRALEKKRARQKKLNVLREYAQDPLTSNDESKNQAQSNIDSKGPYESIPLVGGISSADATQESGNHRFRPLLVSPPAHKKSDKNNKNRSGGPNKRVKRLELTSRPRPVRSEKRSKRCKSRVSTSSEREQETLSSKNCQDSFVKDLAETSPVLIHPLSGNPSVISQSSAEKGKGVHGYLTLQQLQTANGFLFPSRTIPVRDTLLTTHDSTLTATIEHGYVNIGTTESSQVKPRTDETTL